MSEEVEKMENVEQFSIENTEVAPMETEVEVDPIQEIINYDFKNGNDFDFEDNYAHLQDLKSSSDEAKQLESENVIKDLCPKYMLQNDVEEIENLKTNIEAFLRKYEINADYMKAIPADAEGEKLKTKIFAIGQLLYSNFQTKINNICFNINWTRDEYKLINYAFTDKGEYNGESVYSIYELKTQYLDYWKEQYNRLPKTSQNFNVVIDIKNMVMFYHLINKHVVKGLGKDFETFKSILDKIVDTHKIYNSFGVVKERLGVDFNIWVGALSPENAITGTAITPGSEV